jgi:Arc/MetJ-type ribon-helix-helix transcriptional regulator
MALTLTLDPHGEQLVAACLSTGRYHSPEEVVARALESLAEKEAPESRVPAAEVLEAIERLKAFGRSNGLSLGDTTIRQLREEARP